MTDNLRDYSENDKVAEFYKSLYENQSLENNKRLKLKYNSGCNVKMYMIDALNKLDDFIDLMILMFLCLIQFMPIKQQKEYVKNIQMILDYKLLV